MPAFGERQALEPREAPAAAAPASAAQAPRRGGAPIPTREILLDLNIEYVDGLTYDPTTGVDDKVRPRSYTKPGSKRAGAAQH